MQINFIQELRHEHKGILNLFQKIGETEDFLLKKNLIQELATLAVNHLKKEDEQLYPMLANSADLEIKKLGDIFSDAMKTYSQLFISVVEKLLKSENPFDSETLTEFDGIQKKIQHRVTLEETLLYPAYEKESSR